MKNLNLRAIRMALIATCMFYGCEDSLNNQPVQIDDVKSKHFGGCEIGQVCVPKYDLGRPLEISKICAPSRDNVCELYTIEECTPVIISCFWEYDWSWIDPWDWSKYIDEEIIFDLREYLDIKIDPEIDFTTFSINDHLLGLQYYSKTPLINGEVFKVHTSLQLDKFTSETIGLKGDVIPAGFYPIIHNKKNGTYNTIVSIGTYPIKRNKEIAIANFEHHDLKGFLSKPKFEKVIKSTLIEHKSGFGFETEDPEPLPWLPQENSLALFSHNRSSVGLQFLSSKPIAYKVEEGMPLHTDIAKMLEIEPFKLSNEYIEQQFDEKMGTTTILIHRPIQK